MGKPPRDKASEVLEPAGLEGAEEAQGGSAPGGDPGRLPGAAPWGPQERAQLCCSGEACGFTKARAEPCALSGRGAF